MTGFSRAIKKEQKRIQRVIDLIDGIQTGEAGSLITRRRGKNVYYYEQICKNGKCKQQYLGKADAEELDRFVKQKFLKELLKKEVYNQGLLDQLEKDYQNTEPESVWDSLPKDYHQFRERNYIDSRYDELKRWANDSYRKNTAPFPKAEHYAIDGTRVRSKGECIIYNLLYERGIPFRYDPVLEFTDDRGETRSYSPDFLIQCYDGTLIIIEHLGRLYDINYALDFGTKSRWYLFGEFVFGKNYFVTSDNVRGGIDCESIEEVVELIIRRFYQ